jgi:hypothetical protein
VLPAQFQSDNLKRKLQWKTMKLQRKMEARQCEIGERQSSTTSPRRRRFGHRPRRLATRNAFMHENERLRQVF